MRTHLPRAAFAIMAIAATLPGGGLAADSPAIKGLQVEVVDPRVDSRAAGVQRTATIAINYLGQKLVTELNTALQKGSVEDAIDIAHLQRISADGQAIPGMPKITAFKLTSARLLNIANSPDFAEQRVLEEVARTLRTASKPPEFIVQRITLPDGTEEWRGYRPLAALPLCVSCHGPSEAQSVRMRTLLARRASAEPAVDYKPGEWRGLLRVTVQPPPSA